MSLCPKYNWKLPYHLPTCCSINSHSFNLDLYLISEVRKIFMRMLRKIPLQKLLIKLHVTKMGIWMGMNILQTLIANKHFRKMRLLVMTWIFVLLQTFDSSTEIGRFSRYCPECATSISSSVAILKLLFSITCIKEERKGV